MDFLPRQTPNPALPTLLNNPALGETPAPMCGNSFASIASRSFCWYLCAIVSAAEVALSRVSRNDARCMQLGRSCAGYAGAIRQVMADDPFAQRIVTALAPTLAPLVQYAARTPFFSNIITAIASSDDPVVSLLGVLAEAADVWGDKPWSQ